MTTRNIVITTSVLASAIGLGFLSYFLFSKKEEVIDENREQPDTLDAIVTPEKALESLAAPIIEKEKANNEKVDINVKAENLPEESIKFVTNLEELDSLDKPEQPNELRTVSILDLMKESEELKIVEEAPVIKKEIISDEFPLQLGSKGNRVERLQVWLLRNYGYSSKVNSEFDEKTLALVKKHLKMDVIDEEIYNKLEMGKRVYEQTKA